MACFGVGLRFTPNKPFIKFSAILNIKINDHINDTITQRHKLKLMLNHK